MIFRPSVVGVVRLLRMQRKISFKTIMANKTLNEFVRQENIGGGIDRGMKKENDPGADSG
jgi:hypothetical protein